MQLGQYRRFLLACFISVGLFLAFNWSAAIARQPVTSAHAFVIGSDPVDGSTVSIAPAMVRIYFNTPISPASVAYVFGPDGQSVDAAQSSIPANNPRELDTPLKTPDLLPQGSYLVRWTALANDDGHTTSGVIGFNIGRSSAGLPGQVILGPSTSNNLPELNPAGVLAIAWDWLVMMALTFWIGILVMEGLILAGVERVVNVLSRARRQTQPLQWLCLTALLIGEVITLVLRTTHFSQSLSGSSIDLGVLGQIITRSSYGHLWLARVVLVVLAMGWLWWTTRQGRGTRIPGLSSRSRFGQMRQRVAQEQATTKELPDEAEEITPPLAALSQRSTLFWLILAGLILITLALSNDEVALAQPHYSAVVIDWLYLAAQSAWLGGLTYLGYVFLPQLRIVEPETHAETLIILLRRLSPFVLATLAIMLVGGLFFGESSLGSPQQLLTEPYGRALLAKSILVIAMLLLTLYALFFLRPRLTRQAVLLPVVDSELPARRTRQSALEHTERRLKQTFSIQSWLGALVLLCAALMAFYAPPIVFPPLVASQQTTSAPSPVLNAQTKIIGNLSITLEVLPARENSANTVIVILNDKAGNPVSDAQVRVSVNMEIMDMGTASKNATGNASAYIAIFDKDSGFSMSGIWDVTVNIQGPNQPLVQAVFQVTVTP